MSRVLSVDVGGTKVLVGAFDGETQVAEWVTPTRTGGDDVARAVEFARACAQELGPVAAVAAGFPEYVDADGALTSHEVLTWQDQPHALLAAAFADVGVPATGCVVESDVRLGALGEAVHGAGAALDSMLYVSLGTGLSSAFVIGGQVWHGARGEAIALGEHAVAIEGVANLEQLASGAGIATRYEHLTGESVTGRDVIERADDGEARASEIVTTAGLALGDAIADIADVLDPHGVVVGGGLGTAGTRLTRLAAGRFEARQARRPGAPPWITATLGSRCGLWGGAVAAARAV